MISENTDNAQEQNLDAEVAEHEGSDEAVDSSSDDEEEEFYSDESDEDDGDSDNLNSKFAGVRKKGEEKGFNRGKEQGFEEGYKLALEKNRQQWEQQNNFGAPHVQQPMDYANTADTQFNQQAPHNVDPAQAYAQKELTDRLGLIDAKGANKYEDWNRFVGQLSGQAKQAESYGDNSLRQLLINAANMPNGHDVLYKLARDPATVARLKSSPRVTWQEELFGLVKKKSKPKAAHAPVKEIKAPPTSGGKMTDAERNRLALEKAKRI